jgi:hypothetical protein
VPVDGFRSVTVCNKDGYFTLNPQNAYSLNNIIAQRGDDGRTTIQFGGCDLDTQLPADHPGMELHCPAIAPAREDSERRVDIPRSSSDFVIADAFLLPDRSDKAGTVDLTVFPA